MQKFNEHKMQILCRVNYYWEFKKILCAFVSTVKILTSLIKSYMRRKKTVITHTYSSA